MFNLISLSESDKRFIFALCLVIILLFVLVWYLGYLTTKIMKYQGKKLDHYVHDVLVTRVITDKKAFKKYARKKNWRIFFKQATAPIIIMLVAALILVIANSIMRDFSYNPFSDPDKGFATLLFTWDFGNEKYYTYVFGIRVLASWPELVNTPHFILEALPSYLFVPLILTGGIWYLIVCQAYIARIIRRRQLSDQVFEKSLDGFTQTKALNNDINNKSGTAI